MFGQLFDFSLQRGARQAFGWYLCFLLIGLVIAAAAGGLAGADAGPHAAFRGGMHAGTGAALALEVILAILLLNKRVKDATNIALVLSGFVLVILLGALGGLVPLAMLTSRPVEKADPFST